jgi:hypothetical protein
MMTLYGKWAYLSTEKFSQKMRMVRGQIDRLNTSGLAQLAQGHQPLDFLCRPAPRDPRVEIFGVAIPLRCRFGLLEGFSADGEPQESPGFHQLAYQLFPEPREVLISNLEISLAGFQHVVYGHLTVGHFPLQFIYAMVTLYNEWAYLLIENFFRGD